MTCQRHAPPRPGASRSKRPKESQPRIFEAYSKDPNAASVGRSLARLERHVRRIVHQFSEVLEELRRRRNGEANDGHGQEVLEPQDWPEWPHMNGVAASNNCPLARIRVRRIRVRPSAPSRGTRLGARRPTRESSAAGPIRRALRGARGSGRGQGGPLQIRAPETLPTTPEVRVPHQTRGFR